MNSTALICTAALGLLLFTLGLAISTLRFRGGTLSGYAASPDDLLAKLVRAHGNTAEYVPFLAVPFLYLASHNPPQRQVWCTGGATVCRVLLAMGFRAWPTVATPPPAPLGGTHGTSPV